MKKIVQTAGRNALNEFAPQFAHFNDDVLFGENWNNQDIDVKTRCIITVTALIASGMINTSLESIYRSEYKETYQSEVDINEDVSFLSLYIVLKNSSNASAHNVEVYESVLDKNFKNHLFIMGSYVHTLIEKQDSIILCYYIHFDEIKLQNGVKFAEYRFNLNYENIYHRDAGVPRVSHGIRQ